MSLWSMQCGLAVIGSAIAERHAHEISSLCIISSETNTYLRLWIKRRGMRSPFVVRRPQGYFWGKYSLFCKASGTSCTRLAHSSLLDLISPSGVGVLSPCLKYACTCTSESQGYRFHHNDRFKPNPQFKGNSQLMNKAHVPSHIGDCSASLGIQNKIEHRSLPINCRLRSTLGICSKVITQI